jgi:hypothetical protein
LAQQEGTDEISIPIIMGMAVINSGDRTSCSGANQAIMELSMLGGGTRGNAIMHS